jgi:hypothetical protein
MYIEGSFSESGIQFITIQDELLYIQKEVYTCEKEIIWCNRMLNKEGNMPMQHAELYNKKCKLENRILVLKEELGIKNQLSHFRS